jgi:hypothetical protein
VLDEAGGRLFCLGDSSVSIRSVDTLAVLSSFEYKFPLIEEGAFGCLDSPDSTGEHQRIALIYHPRSQQMLVMIWMPNPTLDVSWWTNQSEASALLYSTEGEHLTHSNIRVVDLLADSSNRESARRYLQTAPDESTTLSTLAFGSFPMHRALRDYTPADGDPAGMRPVREGDLLTIHGIYDHDGDEFALLFDSTTDEPDGAQWRWVPKEVLIAE